MKRIRAAWRALIKPDACDHQILVKIDGEAMIQEIRRIQRRRGRPPTL